MNLCTFQSNQVFRGQPSSWWLRAQPPLIRETAISNMWPPKLPQQGKEFHAKKNKSLLLPTSMGSTLGARELGWSLAMCPEKKKRNQTVGEPQCSLHGRLPQKGKDLSHYCLVRLPPVTTCVQDSQGERMAFDQGHTVLSCRGRKPLVRFQLSVQTSSFQAVCRSQQLSDWQREPDHTWALLT